MESIRVPENTAGETRQVRTTYTVTDDEDDEDASTDVLLTLSGADAAHFNLTGSEQRWHIRALPFKQSPNYEDPADAGTDNVYNVTVVATDSDSQTDMMAVTVMVTNLDEDGTLTLSTLQPRVGTPLTATLTDIDGAVSDVTWMWERGTGIAVEQSCDDDKGSRFGHLHADWRRRGATTCGRRRRATPTLKVPVSPQCQLNQTTAVEIDDTNKAPEFPDQDMETDGKQTDQGRMVAENTEAAMNVGSGQPGDRRPTPTPTTH